MMIANPADFEPSARRRLPRFLYDYIAGGALGEETLQRNRADLAAVHIRQRVLCDVSRVDLSTRLFGRDVALPIALAPVGLTGMYARRGEVQAAIAAQSRGIPFTLSTVSVCPLEEVTGMNESLWFQLYAIRDRGFMRALIERARHAGARALVFTVDMPVPGPRRRDAHSGMSGRYATARRYFQAMAHPRWAWDVGIRGRPHLLGNVAPVLESATGLEDFMGWLASNFDPAIKWEDIEWIRECWDGPLLIKGILDPDDARAAARIGADGIIVSNHGGRQLDGAASTARALPSVRDAVGEEITILADGGIRSGLDVVRMLALGADSVLLGRAWVYALAAQGQRGVERLLDMLTVEMRTILALGGVSSLREVSSEMIDRR